MISNTEIIAALDTTNSKTEAAEMLGISRASLYTRLQDPTFQTEWDEYQQIKDDTLKNALMTAQIEAIETLRGIIQGGILTNDDDKLKACSILLKH